MVSWHSPQAASCPSQKNKQAKKWLDNKVTKMILQTSVTRLRLTESLPPSRSSNLDSLQQVPHLTPTYCPRQLLNKLWNWQVQYSLRLSCWKICFQTDSSNFVLPEKPGLILLEMIINSRQGLSRSKIIDFSEIIPGNVFPDRYNFGPGSAPRCELLPYDCRS